METIGVMLDTDFGDLIKQQPAPGETAISEAVTPYLVKRLREHIGSRDVGLTTVLLKRRDSGKEKYGTELKTYNRRDALVDAFQEQLDSCVYLAQHVREVEYAIDGATEMQPDRDIDRTPLFMAEERLSAAIQLMVEIWNDLQARYNPPEERDEGPSIVLP